MLSPYFIITSLNWTNGYLPGGGGPLINMGIMWGGPLGGSGCLMCIGCMGGAPLKLKKLFANSSGGWGRAEI